VRRWNANYFPFVVVETLHHLYTVLAMTQSRLTNIPLFLVYNLQQRFLQSSVDLSIAEIATVSVLLQYTSFFAAGGTNAISSVDLSSAYNGVSDFNVIAVGLLTFVSNWAGSIWWSFAAVVLLLKKRTQLLHADALAKRGPGKEAPASRDAQVFLGYASLLTVFTACSLVFVMAACTLLRTHLFIWTVFSPKFLYCMAWSLGQHMLINIGLGGLLYWFGTLDGPR
jgi:ethanolamine phosphate transferase 2 subunit G